jgi:RNA polymerase sigma-70 factor (ECF subfamily)
MVRHNNDPSSEQALRERQVRFMALLRPYHTPLSRFVHALTQDAEAGRDLLSETILQAYEGLGTLRNDDAFRSYIFTIVRRLHYRQLRRKKWWGVFDPSQAERIADSNSPAPDSRLDTMLLDRAIATLPKKQREAVILFEISGFSLEEIREIQGGSLSGVKSRIVRGRDRLVKMLREDEHMLPGSHRSSNERSTPRVNIALLREDIV